VRHTLCYPLKLFRPNVPPQPQKRQLLMKSAIKWTGGVLAILALGIQLVPVDRTNPPVEEEVPASPEVREVLVRACYDCHSNETVWPWYSYVAPVSWLVARDVNKGREALNFSTWNRLTTRQQLEAMHESWEEADEGEMPLWFYLPTHPDAKLSERDLALLRAWAVSGPARDP
jgi:hypothetical protein